MEINEEDVQVMCDMLRKWSKSDPPNTGRGICTNLMNLVDEMIDSGFSDEELGNVVPDLMHSAWRSWARFSGDNEYPITPLFESKNLWSKSTKEGKDRRSLAIHTASYFERNWMNIDYNQ